MNTKHSILAAGATAITISLIMFIYNFFDMYSLADLDGKCASKNQKWDNCQAVSDWQLMIYMSAGILVIGIITLVIGLLIKSKKKK